MKLHNNLGFSLWFIEDGKHGDLGAHAPQTVMKNRGQERGHAQIHHPNMMEMIVSVTA